MERLSKIEFNKLTDEEKRQRKLDSKKLWRDNNKESYKKYREQNKERIQQYNKIWNENNKEHKSQLDREYRKLHPKSQYTICKTNWKKREVLDTFNDKYKTLYRIYESTKFCDDCATQLDNCNKSRKCLDHCHQSGYFRGVVCHCCNMKRE